MTPTTDEGPAPPTPDEPPVPPTDLIAPHTPATDLSAPLAPHRIALRGSIFAAVGGTACGLTMLLGRMTDGGSLRLRFLLGFLAIGATFCLVLAVGEQVAARFGPPGKRLLGLALPGVFGTLVVSCALVAVMGFVKGGPTQVWLELAEHFEDLAGAIVDQPLESLGLVLSVLVPVVLIGGARVGLRPGGRMRLRTQLLAAVAGGLGAQLCLALVGPAGNSMLRLPAFVMFVGGALAATLGLALAERLERFLLRRFAPEPPPEPDPASPTSE